MTEYFARISTEQDGSWRWELRRRVMAVQPHDPRWETLRMGYALTKDQAIEAARSAKRSLTFQPQVLEIDL